MTPLEFLIAREKAAFAPRGLKEKRLKELQAMVNSDLRKLKPKRKGKRADG